jgi:hypothetical protein
MSYNHFIQESDEKLMESAENMKLNKQLTISIKIPYCLSCLIIPNKFNSVRLIKFECGNDYCIDCVKKNLIEYMLGTTMSTGYYSSTPCLSSPKCEQSNCRIMVKDILSRDSFADLIKSIAQCQYCAKYYDTKSTTLYNGYCKQCIINLIEHDKCFYDNKPYEEHIIKLQTRYGNYVNLTNTADIVSEEMFNRYIKHNILIQCSVCFNKWPCKTINICDCDSKVCFNCLSNNVITNNAITFKKPNYDTHNTKCLNFNCRKQILTKSFMANSNFNRNIKQMHIKPKYCVENNCNGLLNDGVCEKCDSVSCESCHQLFHDGDCEEENLKLLESTVGHGGSTFRNCPKCDELIFKNEGCENMFCWNCSITFNWYDEYDSDRSNNSDGEQYTTFDFTGHNFYKLYKKALKKGISIHPTDFEGDSGFSIEQLYNSDGELSPDSDEEEIQINV